MAAILHRADGVGNLGKRFGKLPHGAIEIVTKLFEIGRKSLLDLETEIAIRQPLQSCSETAVVQCAAAPPHCLGLTLRLQPFCLGAIARLFRLALQRLVW